MNARTRIPITIAFALASVLFSSCTTLQTGRGDIEESADSALRAMSAKLSSAQHLTISATRSIDPALMPDANVKRSSQVKVKVSRPDGVVASSKDSSGTRVLFYNGSSMTLVNWGAKVYASVPVAGSIDQKLMTEVNSIEVSDGDMRISC